MGVAFGGHGVLMGVACGWAWHAGWQAPPPLPQVLVGHILQLPCAPNIPVFYGAVLNGLCKQKPTVVPVIVSSPSFGIPRRDTYLTLKKLFHLDCMIGGSLGSHPVANVYFTKHVSSRPVVKKGAAS